MPLIFWINIITIMEVKTSHTNPFFSYFWFLTSSTCEPYLNPFQSTKEISMKNSFHKLAIVLAFSLFLSIPSYASDNKINTAIEVIQISPCC